MSGGKRYAGDVAASAFAGLFHGLKPLLLVPVLARTLGIGGYGAWLLALSTATLLTAPAIVSLDAALVRLLPERQGAARGRMLSTAALLSAGPVLVVAVLLLAIAPVAGPLLARGSQYGAPMLALAAPLVVANAAWALATAFARAELEIVAYARLSVARDITATALAIGAALLWRDVAATVAAYAAGWIAAAAVAWWRIVRAIGWQMPDRGSVRPLLSFSLPLAVNHPLSWVAKYGNNYILGALLGVGPLGLYGAARTAGEAIRFLSGAVSFALSPTLSNLRAQRDEDGIARRMSQTLRYFILVSVPSVLVFSVWGDGFVLALTGVRDAAAGRAIPVVGLAMVLAGVYAIVSEVLVLELRTRRILLAWTVGGIVQLAASLALTPRFGVFGAAWGDLAAQLAVLLVVIAAAWRWHQVRLDKAFAARLAAAVAVAAVAGGAARVGTGHPLAGVAVAGLAVPAAYFVFGVVSTREVGAAIGAVREAVAGALRRG